MFACADIFSQDVNAMLAHCLLTRVSRRTLLTPRAPQQLDGRARFRDLARQLHDLVDCHDKSITFNFAFVAAKHTMNQYHKLSQWRRLIHDRSPPMSAVCSSTA